MTKLRNWIPLFALLAIAALFFKLPETAKLVGHCKICFVSTPTFTLLAASYFAFLFAFSLLFPTVPHLTISRIGLIWATLLAVGLTALHFPLFCMACLVAHACHLAIWATWTFAAPLEIARSSPLRERLCLLFIAPLSIAALFGSINLTLMAYGAKSHRAEKSLQSGDAAPAFVDETLHESIVIHFVSPDCPFCISQLQALNTAMAALSTKPIRFINISPNLPPELIQLAPTADWLLDQGGYYRDQFKVVGYPTLIIVNPDGKIARVLLGATPELKDILLNSF